MPIDAALREMATGSDSFAMLSTLLPDGQPQSHIMWIDADDEHLLINTEVHRQKFHNIERDPRVTVTIWRDGDPYRYVEVRGEVAEIVRGPQAREHIDACAQRYEGRDYDGDAITSERVILKIAPHRVNHRG